MADLCVVHESRRLIITGILQYILTNLLHDSYLLQSLDHHFVYCPQVSSNGLFSFNRSVNFFSPVRFPNSSSYRYLVAPFWADHDPRPTGQISYEIHNRNTELLSSVNRFIRQQTATNFDGRWLLVAEWNNVAEYGSTADKVRYMMVCNGECISLVPLF